MKLQIDGAHYPPGPVNELIGQICSYAFMATIAVAVGLGNVILPQEYARWVENNRGMVIGAGFVLNMIGNALLQTGAYEIMLDGEVIFSKLKTGQIPNPATVAAIIRSKVLL